jgi:hypothetical protein
VLSLAAVVFVSSGWAGFASVHLEIDAGFKDPLGFHSAAPTFSWQLPAEAAIRFRGRPSSRYTFTAASRVSTE